MKSIKIKNVEILKIDKFINEKFYVIDIAWEEGGKRKSWGVNGKCYLDKLIVLNVNVGTICDIFGTEKAEPFIFTDYKNDNHLKLGTRFTYFIQSIKNIKKNEVKEEIKKEEEFDNSTGINWDE